MSWSEFDIALMKTSGSRRPEILMGATSVLSRRKALWQKDMN
jgi:hypothetical protein